MKLTNEQLKEMTCIRRNVSSRSARGVFANTYRYGRNVVAWIFEPCKFTNYKFSVEVPVCKGYMLCASCDTFADAIEKMGDFLTK